MKVRIENIQSHYWRNENPGEGGLAYSGRTAEPVTMPSGTEYPAGSYVALGGDGFKLVRVEGGFKSVECQATTREEGTVDVRESNGCLVA